MKRAAGTSKDRQEIVWDEEMFDILAGRYKDTVSVDDTVEILHLMEYLKIRNAWKEASYTRLAEKTHDDYKAKRNRRQ